MNLTKLTLIAYFLADHFGDGNIDNQQMVEFLESVAGQQGLNTTDFSNQIQRELRENGQILNVVHGGRGRHGVFQITQQGRARARDLLAALI